MDRTFAMLADPGRRQIIDALRSGERAAGELAAMLPISQPGVSKQLRLLREAGLVRVRQDAQRRLYSLNPQPFADLDAWLRPYCEFWAGRLDALEKHLDQET
jgi:DNA-binding transcriptional ArsR family regulator